MYLCIEYLQTFQVRTSGAQTGRNRMDAGPVQSEHLQCCSTIETGELCQVTRLGEDSESKKINDKNTSISVLCSM